MITKQSLIVVGPRPQTSRQVTSTEQPPLTEDKAECDDVIELPDVNELEQILLKVTASSEKKFCCNTLLEIIS